MSLQRTTDATFVCSVDAEAAARCVSPLEVTVGEGPHTVTVAAELGGARDDTPASASWTVDLTPPDTTVAGPSGTVTTSDASFDLAASEPATFECALDGDLFVACDTPHQLNGLPPGEHVLRARAVDRAGNRDPEPAEARWTIDVSGPAVVLDGTPAEGEVTASLMANFTFTSEPAATFFCSLDGEAFDDCTSPARLTVGGGAHRFVVRAEDETGNEGPSVARQWTVDNVGPTTTLMGMPAEGAVINTRAASFTFTAEAGARFRCSIDGAPFAGCASPQNFTTSATEGNHTFAVRALDTLDNEGPVVTRTWRLDLTAPTVNLTGTPGNGDTTNRRDVSFTFTSEAGARFECSRDGAAFSSCTSPQNYTVAGADGPHSFAARATDVAGNPGAPSAIAWTLVTVGPTVTLGGTPAEGATTNQPVNFTFTGTGAVRFECRRDAAAFAACTSPQSFGFPTGGSADGPHTFAVRGFDAIGNPGTPATRTFNWDTVGPAIATLTGGPPNGGVTTNPGFVYSFTAAEAGATFQCEWDNLGVHACPGQDRAPWSGTPPQEADHIFTVRAFDAMSNPGPVTTRSFHLDTNVPDAFLDSRPPDACPGTIGVQILGGGPATFTFHSNDPAATLLCQLDGALPLEPCTSPRTYTGLALTQHSFFIRALDAAGNISNGAPGLMWTNVATCP
jgi:large repetitive protein